MSQFCPDRCQLDSRRAQRGDDLGVAIASWLAQSRPGLAGSTDSHDVSMIDRQM
jgi:hypothetical protein